MSNAWQQSRNWLSSHPGHDFWIRWYEAALEGRPLTGDWESHWHLLADIALIDDADWNLGAEHIAGLIAEIEERHRLLLETRHLRAQLAPIVTEISPSPIGHNNPPEALGDILPAQSVLIVWGALDEAETELEKSKPDKSALRRIADSLLKLGAQISKYIGQKVDKLLDNAAAALGTSLGLGIAAKLAGLDTRIIALGKDILRLIGN